MHLSLCVLEELHIECTPASSSLNEPSWQSSCSDLQLVEVLKALHGDLLPGTLHMAALYLARTTYLVCVQPYREPPDH